jgi:hypothetical protein
MNGLSPTLAPYAKMCHEAIYDFATLMAPFFETIRLSEPRTHSALGLLSMSCLSTSDTASFLVGYSRLWDVEILMRSVLEGTYKFIAMCSRDQANRLSRVKEYWDHLPEVAKLRTNRRAKDFLEIVDDPDSDAWRPIRDLLLPQEVLDELQQRYPRKVQDGLEKGWSFGGLAKALAASDLPAAKYLSLMLHDYGLSSHLVHQDGDGVMMIWERDQRSIPRREALELAHGLSELSDIFHLAMFRALAAYHMLDLEKGSVLAMNSKYSVLLSRIDEARVTWHEVEYGEGR